MSIPFLSPINLSQNELQNARIQNLANDPSSPVVGQIWYNSASNVLKIYDGTANQILAELANTLDEFGAPVASLNLNSQNINNLATPVASTDAATKGYVDSVALGLDVKASCHVASTGNIVVASGLVNGVTIDGVTVATGDRVLLKDQTSQPENGIYIVAASGAAARSSDCNSSTNYVSGSFTFIEAGTANAGSSWVVSTQGTINPGTTAVTWVQFSGGATYTGSGAIDISGTTISLNTDGVTIGVNGSDDAAVISSATQYQVLVSQGSGDAAWGAVNLSQSAAVTGTLPITSGGTGQITAAAALTALGGTTKYATYVGNSSSASIVVTHNLGTQDVIVQVYQVASPNDQVQVEVQYTGTNSVTLVFSAAPTTNQYRVVVIG